MIKKVGATLSLIVGLAIFVITLKYFGTETINVFRNFQTIYLIPFIILVLLTVCANALRLKIILKAYNKQASFWNVLRLTFAGYAVSYITPSARIGGEPLKAYMLNKDCGVGLRTASSAVIIDKFVELFGSAATGVVALGILFCMPNIPNEIKTLVMASIIVSAIVLIVVYYMTIKNKGPFSSLFTILQFYKIPKWAKFGDMIKSIEGRMAEFFKNNKKEFILSFLCYLIFISLTILEFKLIFMMINVQITVTEVILITVLWGLMNFVPVPAGLGVQEISQSGLLKALKGTSSFGLAFSLLARAGVLIIVVIGILIATQFSSKEIIQKYKSNNHDIKKCKSKKRK